jgi:hypothetical protein
MPTRSDPIRLISSSVTLICRAGFVQVVDAQGPQVPIPQTAAEVSGPAPGPKTRAYVQAVGRVAYDGAAGSWCVAVKRVEPTRTC